MACGWGMPVKDGGGVVKTCFSSAVAPSMLGL